MKILGNGVDIVEVGRIRKSIQKWGKNFLSKVFTPRELRYVRRKKNRFESLAARFATKEAVVKAFGEREDRPSSLRQIEVVNTKEGVPKIVLHAPNGKGSLQLPKEVVEVVVSMSHSKSYAVGTALLIGKETRKKR
ncbi:MAG: holo-ACP synthase [Candidatus Omnitrophica bacterium]|nr:holo-ACP synthase [Candidatus Omnitrophota bacterium]